MSSNAPDDSDFSGQPNSPLGPGNGIVDVDSLLSDDTDLATPLRQIRAGTAEGSTIKVKTGAGLEYTFRNVQQGEIFSGWFLRVFSTGTTATNMDGWE